MTTFEITIVILLVAIVMLLIIAFIGGIATINAKMKESFQYLGKKVEYCSTKLGYINGTAQSISQQLNNIENSNDQDFEKLTDIVDKMHRNLCVDIADKMVERTFPIKEGEPLDAAFEPDYKLKKDIECKLNGFAAAVLDAECCTKEIVDFWLERICDAAYKYINQLKIDWDKLSKEQQDEFLKRLIMPNYDSPFQPPFDPTCETTNNNE